MRRRRHAEHRRLAALPRREPTTTTLLGPAFRVVDAASFLAQYSAFFESSAYHVRFTSAAPRILDCGANVGVSVLFWKTLAPTARITAFEADPEIARILAENIASARVNDVDVVAAAVATHDGTVTFAPDGADAGRVGGDRVVKAVRLRDYVATPVDLLKVDIEGDEAAVLLDCADRLRHVERIVLEYHSFVSEPQRLGDIVRVLERAGFRLIVDTEYATPSPLREVRSGVVMDNRLIVYAIRPGAQPQPR